MYKRQIFYCTLFEGFGLDDVTVDSSPPSIVENEPYAIDEGYVSDCCRFVTLWMSVPPMSGGVHELDLKFRIEFGLSSGGGPRMTVLLDSTYGGLYGQRRISIWRL